MDKKKCGNSFTLFLLFLLVSLSKTTSKGMEMKKELVEKACIWHLYFIFIVILFCIFLRIFLSKQTLILMFKIIVSNISYAFLMVE